MVEKLLADEEGPGGGRGGAVPPLPGPQADPGRGRADRRSGWRPPTDKTGGARRPVLGAAEHQRVHLQPTELASMPSRAIPRNRWTLDRDSITIACVRLATRTHRSARRQPTKPTVTFDGGREADPPQALRRPATTASGRAATSTCRATRPSCSAACPGKAVVAGKPDASPLYTHGGAPRRPEDAAEQARRSRSANSTRSASGSTAAWSRRPARRVHDRHADTADLRRPGRGGAAAARHAHHRAGGQPRPRRWSRSPGKKQVLALRPAGRQAARRAAVPRGRSPRPAVLARRQAAARRRAESAGSRARSSGSRSAPGSGCSRSATRPTRSSPPTSRPTRRRSSSAGRDAW